METDNQEVNAEVIAVYPDRVRISVDDLSSFKLAEERIKQHLFCKFPFLSILSINQLRVARAVEVVKAKPSVLVPRSLDNLNRPRWT